MKRRMQGRKDLTSQQLNGTGDPSKKPPTMKLGGGRGVVCRHEVIIRVLEGF